MLVEKGSWGIKVPRLISGSPAPETGLTADVIKTNTSFAAARGGPNASM